MKIILLQLLTHRGNFLSGSQKIYLTPELLLCYNITKIETIKVFMKQ